MSQVTDWLIKRLGLLSLLLAIGFALSACSSKGDSSDANNAALSNGQQQQQAPVPSQSPSPVASASPAPTPSASPAPLPSATPSPTASATPAPSPSPSASPVQTVKVSISSGAVGLGTAAFGVNPLVVPVGTTVTWTNNDSVPHTATSDSGAFDSGNLAPGQSYSFQFTQAGSYPYHCSIHGAASMSGVIQVQ